ncbi:MAG: acetyl-CoA hydrolase, partial [Nocardioidaceae bacterium]
MESLHRAVSGLPERPRVVASGSFATPTQLLAEVDQLLPAYRLWILNAQVDLPDREGVELETSFVGAAMRSRPRLHYIPSRLSLVPRLFQIANPPDVVLLHTSLPRDGTVSLGTDVAVLPSAIEVARRRGGVVLAQANRQMPYTFGDGVVSLEDVDALIEVDLPLASPPPVRLDEASVAIGELVAG